MSRLYEDVYKEISPVVSILAIKAHQDIHAFQLVYTNLF